MWFLFQQPEDFLERFRAERERAERNARLLRALRSGTPRVDSPVQRGQERAMAEPPCNGKLAAGRS